MPGRIAESDRKLLKRAAFSCEYCGESVLDGGWHLDHVLPRSAGGSNEPGNLAVACSRCNVNKGVSVVLNDPLTGSPARVFSPRHDSWDAHFRRLNHFVAGKTPVGRATAKALFRQTPRSPLSSPLPRSLGAPLLDGTLDAYIRWLYGQRKASAFSTVFHELDGPEVQGDLSRILASLRGTGLARSGDVIFAIEKAGVLAEALTTRCHIEDLLTAVALCATASEVCRDPVAFPAYRRLAYFQNKHALAWHQLAVCLALAGSVALADACAAISLLIRQHAAPSSRGTIGKLGSAPSAALAAEWDARPDIDKLWEQVVTRARNGQIEDFLYVADGLTFHGSARQAESLGVVETCVELLDTSGYGMDADVHYGVLLMRRTLLAQARFAPSAITSRADLHLREWADWDGRHQIRGFVYALALLRQRFDSRVDDLLSVGMSMVSTGRLSAAAESDIETAIARFRLVGGD